MKYILALIIIFSLANHSSAAYSPNDIEWASAVSGTVTKVNPVLTNGNYTVKALEFSSPVPGVKDIKGNIVPETDVEPMVMVDIYRDNVLIKEKLILSLQSEAYIDKDYEVKVFATSFPLRNAKEWVLEFYNPSATISIQLRALPVIEVSVTTDKSVYTSYVDQIITAKVTVKNTGDAFAKNVNVNLDLGELKLRGGDSSQLHQYYNRIEKDISQSYEVILVVPQLLDEKIYNLTADANGMDVKEKAYKADTEKLPVTVSPKQNYFSISKSMRDRMYLQNIATVTVKVGNNGMLDVYNIHVNDSLNEKFELRSNTTLQWDIPVLHPGQEWGTTYSVKPLEAKLEGFSVPPASAGFTVNKKQYSVSSDTITVVVNGPKVQMNKTVDRYIVNLSEDVNVTVTINNTGNIGTRIEVKDILPVGVSLIRYPSNITTWSGTDSTITYTNYSEKDSAVSLTYTMKMLKEGEIRLPPAIANYTDIEYRGTTRAVLSSEQPVITVIDPARKNPVPTPEAILNLTETGATESLSSTEVVEIMETAPSETPSFWKKLLNRLEGKSTDEPASDIAPTPTPITPGFETAPVIYALLIYAFFRRR